MIYIFQLSKMWHQTPFMANAGKVNVKILQLEHGTMQGTMTTQNGGKKHAPMMLQCRSIWLLYIFCHFAKALSNNEIYVGS